MKYSQIEAEQVLSMFERYLCQNIKIEEYHTESFFHVFVISPIVIGGIQRTKVRFKDSLVDDCIAMQGDLLDIEDFVNFCFL